MKRRIVRTAFLLVSLFGFAGCAGEDIPENADAPEKAHVVLLERHLKLARYFSCEGQLVREAWETVRPPTKDMEIKPVSRNAGAIVSSDIHNLTTNDQGSILNHTKFVIDLSPSVFNLHVRKGINEIAYEFQFADQDTENGSRFINVKYRERRLEGVNEYHPEPELCPEEPAE